jgi:hypothetical protein
MAMGFALKTFLVENREAIIAEWIDRLAAETGVLTPKYHAIVAENSDQIKYCSRIHGEAKNLVREMFANFTERKGPAAAFCSGSKANGWWCKPKASPKEKFCCRRG